MKDYFLSIYETVQGVLTNPTPPFPVENAFTDGSACNALYAEIYRHKILINDRLGQDENPDLEYICDCFWDIMEMISRKMYECGGRQVELELQGYFSDEP